MTLFLELRKSITEAKGACSKTVKTSKSLEKKTKKGKHIITSVEWKSHEFLFLVELTIKQKYQIHVLCTHTINCVWNTVFAL